MPAYLIRHPAEQRREDVLLTDSDLVLRFEGGWAIFSDASGICLAIPSGQGAHIERVGEDQDQQPALPKG